MRKRVLRASVLVVFAVTIIGVLALPLASADWPMFHSDAAHDGVGAGNTSGSELLWKHTTGGWVWSSPAVVNDVVFVGSSDHSIYALNATTGAILWSYATGNESRSSPAVSNGIVYIGSMDTYLYALNASTGSALWSYPTGAAVDSSPVVVDGIVYFGSLDGSVTALSAADGTLRWSVRAGIAVVSSPAVVGGVVYVGSMDSSVYALNASSGAQIWAYATGGSVYCSPSVVGGVVYVGSFDNSIYAINATTGTRVWSYATGDYANSCPAVSGGIVYAGSKDGALYALNAADGSLVWKYQTGGIVSSSPAVVGGVVYVGSEDGHLYALNAQSGAVQWAYQSGAVVSSPAIVNGVIYFGSYDDSVYALESASSTSVLNQVWVPQPASAAEAVGVSVVVVAAASFLISFASNPIGATVGEEIGKKTEDMVPDEAKEWLEEVVSSKQKLKVGKKKTSVLRPGGAEVLAYATSVALLAISFTYVKISSMDQFWVLIPVFFGTSVLIGLVQKYWSIVFLRRRGIWSEHKIWPLGFVLFLFTTFVFKVPFSSPTRSAHEESSKEKEKLLAQAAALEILIALGFAALFFLLIEVGVTGIGGAGLAICVIGALSGTIPVKPMSGKDIFDYSKRRWTGLFLITLAVFVGWLFLM